MLRSKKLDQFFAGLEAARLFQRAAAARKENLASVAEILVRRGLEKLKAAQ